MDIRFKSIKGMDDLLPSESPIWLALEKRIRRFFLLSGFGEIRTPILEYAELFIRGVGEGTDIVDKEMYTFRDKDGELVSLRPEGTASIVRAVVEHNLIRQEGIHRLFYLGPMFRYERPQRGRLRQFHQFGAEILGIQDSSVDGELIYLGNDFLKGLGVPDGSYITRVNSLGCLMCRKDFRDSLVKYLNQNIVSLCDDCKRRILTNPLRILDCKNQDCRRITENAPLSTDFLCGDCKAHFEGVMRLLDRFEVRYEIDHRLVRGLDYYSRTTFEIQITGGLLGSQNTVIAGGRYDSLFKDFIGSDYPAIGFAGGMERLIEVIDKSQFSDRNVFMVSFISHGGLFDGGDLRVVEQLRKQDIIVEVDIAERSYKAKFKRADRLGSHLAIIKGEDEARSGVYTLKDLRLSMDSKEKQFSVSAQNIVNEVIKYKNERYPR